MTAPQWVTWIGETIALAGTYEYGRNRATGPALGVVNQFFWAYIAIEERLYGMLVASVIFAVINLYNLIKWRQRGKATSRTAQPAAEE